MYKYLISNLLNNFKILENFIIKILFYGQIKEVLLKEERGNRRMCHKHQALNIESAVL